MGCGQSVDSAYSSRRRMSAKAPHFWAQSATVPGRPPDRPATQPMLDREILEEYLQLERDIAEAQRENSEATSRLNTRVEALNTAPKREDHIETGIDNLRYSVMNIQEAPNERDAAQEVDDLQTTTERLKLLHLRQDELLAKIFGGGYGSKREAALEAELDVLEAKRNRLMEANFKWRQAQMMLEYACKQLAAAMQKWQDLPDIPTIELEIRYTTATEARNSLMTASRSTASSHTSLRSLPDVSADSDTPNKDVQCVFETGDTDDPEVARQRLQNNHKKASSLLHWFEQVVNTTITQDLAATNRQVHQTTLALRDERVNIIKQKVREIWGDDVDIEVVQEVINNGGQVMPVQHEDDTDLAMLDKSTQDFLARLDPSMNLEEIDMSLLANNEEIFGKSYEEFKRELDNMREQHEIEMGQFLREQDRQTSKIRGDLQARLEARRRYRAMRRLENKQRDNLRTRVA